MIKIWLSQNINTLATSVNVRAWVFIYRNLFKSYDNKLKVLDVCAGGGKFVELLIEEGLVDRGASMDRYLPDSSLNHEFIKCDITLPAATHLSFKPELISINNSIQLFSDAQFLLNFIKFYDPKFVLITKPSEVVIDTLIRNGYRHNQRLVPVQKLFTELGYALKQKGSVLKVHYKITPAKYVLATALMALAGLIRSNYFDDCLFNGDYYEYLLFEKG